MEEKMSGKISQKVASPTAHTAGRYNLTFEFPLKKFNPNKVIYIVLTLVPTQSGQSTMK
jgi:hypothetical protein